MTFSREPILLLSFPPETLLSILSHLDPLSLSHFSLTCHYSHSIALSPPLFKSLFLSTFDPPPLSTLHTYDYSTIYQQRTRAQKWCHSEESITNLMNSLNPNDWVQTIQSLLDVALTRTPSTSFDTPSKNQFFLATTLKGERLNLLSPSPSPSPTSTSTSTSTPHPHLRSSVLPPSSKSKSKSSLYPPSSLQSYYHLLSLSTPTPHTLSSNPARTEAREIVYRRTNFERDSSWGPYLPGCLRESGEKLVDWEKVKALQVVMGANMREAKRAGWGGSSRDYPRGWDSTRVWQDVEAVEEEDEDDCPSATKGKSKGKGKGKAILSEEEEAKIKEERKKEKERDWAGVDGLRLEGTYCFLDYQSYQHFNFHRSRQYSPSLEDETEAVGECMQLDLKLLPLSSSSSTTSSSLPPTITRPTSTTSSLIQTEEEEDSSDSSDEDFNPSSDTEMTDPDALSSSSDTEALIDSDDASNDSDYVPPPSSSSSANPPSPSTASPSSSLSPNPSSTTSLSRPRLNFIGESRRLSFAGTFHSASFPSDSDSDDDDVLNPHRRGTRRSEPKRIVNGSVSVNKRGEVCWKFVISYGGMRQWRLEGVQVGGVKSRWGVVGTWSTADHDEAGPNGPFWYWPATRDV